MVGRCAEGHETDDKALVKSCRIIGRHKRTQSLQTRQGQLARSCGATLKALTRGVAPPQECWQGVGGSDWRLDVQTVLDIQINATASYIANLGRVVVAKHLLNP